MQSKTSKIVLAVIVIAIIVGGFAYYWQSSKQSEVVNLDKNSTSLKVINGGSFSYDSGSMARDCHYVEGEITDGVYKGKKIVTIFFDYRGKLLIKNNIVTIFVAESKLEFKRQLSNRDESYMKYTDYCVGLEASDQRKNEWANNIEKQKLFSYVLIDTNK